LLSGKHTGSDARARAIVNDLRFQTETQPAVHAARVDCGAFSGSDPTMSTVEVAELTGKRHDNVLADARIMLATLKKDRLSFEGIFFDSYGRPQPCLNLPKLECLTLVTGYSAELRYRLSAPPRKRSA
jgi:phage regulator Rha-like protein